MSLATVNPATGQTLDTYPLMTPAEVDAALDRAAAAAAALRRTTFAQRAGWLTAAADLLDAETAAVAATVTTEMGKPVTAARAEVAKCAAACRYYAAHAEEFLADAPLADPGQVGAARAWVRYEPLGPVLAVMPWNFPLWQVLRFAAPALMAGNPGVLKHASNVPRTARYLGKLFTRAGFPAGSFGPLWVAADTVADVIADPRIAAVTLTGSEGAGRSVGGAAGRALKKVVLELGGSDPFLVLPSADLDRAVDVAVTARCQNNGQSCIAAKRFVVHSAVYPRFVEAFTARMAALRVGDPMEEDTQVGPLATESGRAEVAAQVDDARAHGAQVRCGGTVPDRPGWWYPPTVVTGLTPAMRMWREEVFGPVAGVYEVDSLDAALALADDTPFGLGAAVWTRDEDEAARCVRELTAGAVFVNGMTTSYPALPFGGVRHSGHGRELAAVGIREFCNAKTVWQA
ncbi:succinate-semialdehyde dehydrogenase [NADP(+)] 1 [Pilimelia terevasa]|uniref:Succinate-semialdehyde dehydrogenase [NADP(+)] 1 n=1 Tax=Pilimelia terevasa TaxID=53372 RepID=A0A8J3BFV3_9ACTN|nr:NADP-dependent succinic semialdehyde dehydrogenase [Pilimelia terevasa]GGK18451.1 succinate-semialdehyde dehydrogenase [NADP(+)] 1 [Pilimelia terevasa]